MHSSRGDLAASRTSLYSAGAMTTGNTAIPGGDLDMALRSLLSEHGIDAVEATLRRIKYPRPRTVSRPYVPNRDTRLMPSATQFAAPKEPVHSSMARKASAIHLKRVDQDQLIPPTAVRGPDVWPQEPARRSRHVVLAPLQWPTTSPEKDRPHSLIRQ